MKKTYYKVTTPLRTRYYTPTEWIESGETTSRLEVQYCKNIDPILPDTFRLEIVQAYERPEEDG